MFELFSLQRKDDTPSFRAAPNHWDFILLPLVLTLVLGLAYVTTLMGRPFSMGSVTQISLAPEKLPFYLLCTMTRMFIALGFSLLFSFVFAIIASKYSRAEKCLVPMLDILQSVPILGFQAIAIAPFIGLFPGSMLGVECAAIFAIFTSQAWNMAFSLHQSMRTIPQELNEASRIFRLSAWQRFWRLELPYAMPPLLWNMMMSMSGGWFFLVAAEAISVSGQDIKLPGIGSYIALAIDTRDGWAILWAMVAMLFGILLYDQLFFRPLLAWADKFRFEESHNESTQQSWLLDWIRRSRLTRAATDWIWIQLASTLSWFSSHKKQTRPIVPSASPINPWSDRLWDAFLMLASLYGVFHICQFIRVGVEMSEVMNVFLLGLLTLLRITVLIALASLIWVPISVWIGMRPRYSQKIQAIAQFLAAFPVNLAFPLVIFVLVHYQLTPNIWLSPLIIFGTQWYIVFNVIAGASRIPNELRLAADNLGLKGWLKWKRFYLPAIFPSYITGAITASGGSWNASIVAEYVTWGKTTLAADGLGSYIREMTSIGDFHRIALGITVMCLFVMILNRFFWRKLYRLAENLSH